MNTASKEKNNDSESTCEPPRFTIGVRIRGSNKSVRCNPGDFNLRVGMTVIVDTEDGPQLARVASNKIINFDKDHCSNPPKILRVANPNDLTQNEAQEKRERRATHLCLDLIERLKLHMNLSHVVFFKEMNKSIFYFSAEGRIDFRELVKQLASQLKHRIEMRQLGVRDIAKALTGYGMCGQSLCCSTFLPEFSPVTIRMAKDQGLALNPGKISGVCGRLMCCLQYEHETYREMIKELPKVGKTISTPEGPGRVIKNDILKQMITVRLDADYIMYYHLDELRDSMSGKPKSS